MWKAKPVAEKQKTKKQLISNEGSFGRKKKNTHLVSKYKVPISWSEWINEWRMSEINFLLSERDCRYSKSVILCVCSKVQDWLLSALRWFLRIYLLGFGRTEKVQIFTLLSQSEEMALHKVGLSFWAFQKETLLCSSFTQWSFPFVPQKT
jgi:hypothetical protein